MSRKGKVVSIQIPEDMLNILEDIMRVKMCKLSVAIKLMVAKGISIELGINEPTISPETPIRKSDPVLFDSPSILTSSAHISNNLRNKGIDPAIVLKAKRNKDHGREYDTSLEQYFNMI